MKEKARTILSFSGRVGFSAALLFYLFKKIDVEKTLELLRSADLVYIGCGALVFLLINFFILYRWFIFIRALNLDVPLFTAMRYFFIGLFGNLFLPSSVGGDIIKILGLCQVTHQKPRVVASVLLDRLSGFGGMIVVAIGAYIFGHALIPSTKVVVLIVLMAVASLVIGGVLFNERLYEFGCRVFNRLPRVKQKLMELHYDIALLKGRPLEGWKGIGMSALAQVTLAVVFYLSALALHQNISMIYFLVFVPIICVASSFPSIGGLGVREAGAAYLFTQVGVDPGVAVSLSLMSFLFMVMVGLIGGAVYVFTISSGRVQYPASDAGVRPVKG